MKILTLIIASLFLFLSPSGYAREESKLLSNGYSLLKLQVIPAHIEPVIYQVSLGSPRKLVVVHYDGPGGYGWGNIKKETELALSESQYEKILEKLKSALEFSLLDDVSGKDGSTWILESRLFQNLRVSIWSPRYDSEKRGYENLLKLEEYLKSLESKHESKKTS